MQNPDYSIMTIKKIRNKWFYDMSSILIILFVLYTLTLQAKDTKLIESINSFSLLVTGMLPLIRSYQLDQLRRIKDNRELVDFWLFRNETSLFSFFINYFLVYPIRIDQSNQTTLKLSRRINLLTLLTYLSLLLFILTIFLND